MELEETKIQDMEEYRGFSLKFDDLIDFFDNLSDLFDNGRMISFITEDHAHFFNASLIKNAAQTLRSVKLCCSIGSFSDANTLIRRFRDDLILYVYILDIINKRKLFNEEDLEAIDINDPEQFAKSFGNVRMNLELTDDEKAVDAWLSNTVNDLANPIKRKLSFENYMNVLKKDELVADVIEEYKLHDYWDELRKKLNDYVHNNGIQVAYQNYTPVNCKSLSAQFNSVKYRVSFISSFFVVLLLMIESSLISSSDYIDHLELDLEPPEDSQYFVAPFVQKFIDSKVIKLHPELKQYLQDNNVNGMKIE